jgi:hypothetical protein
MAKSFITESGKADVVINTAPLRDVFELKNAIAREIASTGMKIDFGSDLASLISAFLLVDSSPKVYAALLTCLSRCTYNGDAIKETVFEDEAARGDYYEVVMACAEENLRPFFKGLASRLNGMSSLKNTDTPKSK